MLRTIILDVDYVCNLSCVYCDRCGPYANSDVWPVYKTSFSVAERIAALDRLDPDHVIISGGEPLIMPWLIGLIAGVQKGIGFTVFTNGNLNMTDFVREIDPERILEIYFSFHLASLKVPVDYFIGNVLMLKRRKYPVKVGFVLHPLHLHSAEHYASLFREEGVHFECVPMGVSFLKKSVRITEQEYVQYRHLFSEFSSSIPGKDTVGQFEKLNWLATLDSEKDNAGFRGHITPHRF